MKLFVQQTVAVAVEPFISRSRPADLERPVSRATFRAMVPIDALELGPFDCPFLPKAQYFDILDQEALRARAIEHSRNPDGCPEIHYSGRLQDVDRTFDAVVSSHVVEHVPDLIGHLEEVARLLEHGGCYFLIVPDKRYCFDHFLPESTLEDVQVGRGRLLPTEKAVRDHRTMTTHNSSPLHWMGIHGKPVNDTDAAARDIEHLSRGEYVDVHQWTFTPFSFKRIVTELGIFGEVVVYDTAFGDLEFKAILRR